MFETYYPRRFCKDLVAIRGHSAQLSMLMAVVLGIKPCMDDWISNDRYDMYKIACKKYGLLLKESSVFYVRDRKFLPAGVVGRDRLTTTIAYGHRYFPGRGNHTGKVHVFISRSQKALEKCFQNGWYPIIIKNRVIDKPIADVYHFGQFLGYPTCCIDFFRKFNNWSKYNYLYETLKNTSDIPTHYVCNPFAKDDIYTYIYHMPCSYGCAATKKLALGLRKAIMNEEPEFAIAIDRHLQMPWLVIYERNYFAFEGSLYKGGVIRYRKVYAIGQNRNAAEKYLKVLIKGDTIRLEGRQLFISRKGKRVAVICAERRQFAPEYPFVMQFSF